MSTLNPYSGTWDFEQASFLLGRTVFGKTKAQIDEAISLGLEKTIDKLLEINPLPDPPVHSFYEEDPTAGIGETWVHKFVPAAIAPMGLQSARRRSHRSWLTGLAINEGFSIREKMVLFWHEHMPISGINSGEFEYQYSNLLRKNALGNFRTMIEEITIDPAMLRYLNGNENTKESPNENYARELLELFTLGVGEAVSPGDYTNYTEKDIIEIARALTGWVARINDAGQGVGTFINFRHDTGTKQLSHRFDNAVISNEGEYEYLSVIDIILEQKEVARHICRKLHLWFVGSDINDGVETDIIEPLAQILIDNSYELIPVIRTLLSSEYYLDGTHIGCMLSSPLDYILKMVNTFEVSIPDTLNIKYRIWSLIYEASAVQGMQAMMMPSVAGWKAYYQSPYYYQFWINSFTLTKRDEISTTLLNGLVENNPDLFRIKTLDFISKIENATDPNELIVNIASLIFPVAISQNQIDFLKETLIPGLPDFEWTVEYGLYLDNPEDEEVKIAVESKLKRLFKAMSLMPEFHMM